ncbi:ABC transporter permease [Halomonas cupida]|uniref:ABC transporter permease n=1 Tax=Halomonas cupida TaxID=44933 RepID=A0A1M7FDT6_9GAMM|nr:sugar ABC transporter permease [Halomonas cupida]GEN23511.1 ABC transporter permease [Halomonas cupida]SHM02156.1 putative xylitol transport system permease protein [Halomonas cupida]
MNQASSSATPTTSATDHRNRITGFLSDYGIIVAFIVLCVILSVVSPYFLGVNNLLNVLRQVSINGVLAIGMTFVILTRGIDLSVGSMMAFAAMVAASFAVVDSGMPLIVPLTLGLAAGLALGCVNGVMVARFAIPPFVMTLGMLSMARGLTYIYSDGMPISSLSPSFLWLGQGMVVGIPVPVILFAAVFMLAWFTLRYTTFGRYVYAVGGNPTAARLSGIKVSRITFSVYAISGLLCGLAGLMIAARTSAALPQAGVAYELDAIAAVVIGGTSLAGGKGRIVGTLFGVLIIGVINNGLDLLGVSSFYQQLVKGAIIVVAVMLDRSRLSNT